MIYITDHQTDDILDFIPEESFWLDDHIKTMENNTETFKFITFADKPFSEYLSELNRIVIPDEDNQLIEFYIFNARESHQRGTLTCEVLTVATYSTLKTAKVINPHTTGALSAEAHVQAALSGTEWQIGTVVFNGVRTFDFEDYTNPLAYLKRIASEFELELHFRVESNGNKIVRRYVDLLERVGSWQGREVEFGKDLDNIERIEDNSNIVTALIGLGPVQENGERLEVFVEDREALQRWGRKGQHIINIYEPMSTDQEMTAERLRTLTETELKKRVKSIVQYKANVIDLENVSGLEHEKIRFGDTIRIKDLKFNPPLYLEARVHSVSRSIKTKGRKTVELGDFIEYTEEEVMDQIRSIRQQLDNKVTMTQLGEVAVLLNKSYNGAKFTENGGFESLRSDGLVRTIGNAVDGFAIQERASESDEWVNVFYVNPVTRKLTFIGDLGSAGGTFSGKVEAAQLVIDNPNIEQEGTVGLIMQSSVWQENPLRPFLKTGYVHFNTLNNGLEITRYATNGNENPLNLFEVNARASQFLGYIISANGYGYGQFGAESASSFHIRTSLPRFYFDKPLHVVGGLVSEGGYIESNSFQHTGSPSTGDLYFRGNPGREVRIVDRSGLNNYIPIRASEFLPPSSTRESKKDIEIYDQNVLDVFRSMNIYTFLYNWEEDSEKKRLGFMLDEVPDILHSKGGDTPELYTAIGYLFKGLKDVISEVDQLKQ